MALVFDTGPLYASLDQRDAYHLTSRSLIETSREALVIPAPVLVEVDYWVNKWLGPQVFVALLDDIAAGVFTVEALLPQDYLRVRELCHQYSGVHES